MNLNRFVSHALATTFVVSVGLSVGMTFDMTVNEFTVYDVYGMTLSIAVMSHISGAYNKLLQLL